MKTTELARFDIRLSKEQKQLFERAAILGGYRNLTDFVIATLQSKAKAIIEERERVIASQKDSMLFFEALENPPKLAGKLLAAINGYRQLTADE